jgi:hypothetical protein
MLCVLLATTTSTWCSSRYTTAYLHSAHCCRCCLQSGSHTCCLEPARLCMLYLQASVAHFCVHRYACWQAQALVLLLLLVAK